MTTYRIVFYWRDVRQVCQSGLSWEAATMLCRNLNAVAQEGETYFVEAE